MAKNRNNNKKYIFMISKINIYTTRQNERILFLKKEIVVVATFHNKCSQK